MPLWIIVMIAGATGCGFLFLKARQVETRAVYKKVTGRTKTVRKAAKRLAAQPSGIVEQAPVTSEEEISMSRDLSGQVASDLAEILEEKGV